MAEHPAVVRFRPKPGRAETGGLSVQLRPGGLIIKMAVEWLNVANEAELDEAAEVYIEGQKREIPPGNPYPKDALKEKLKRSFCLVFKSNGRITGLLVFHVKGIFKKSIVMDFICSLDRRKGVGIGLMQALANFAVQANSAEIYSSVSAADIAALNFYFKKCGFQKVGVEKINWPTPFEVFIIAAKPGDLLRNLQRR